jgi:dihydrofolate reductase
MTADAPKVTLHMVASLDGFIAKKNNDIAWLDTADHYEQGVAGEDAAQFVKAIDCYVMGSRTYEHAVALSRDFGWAYGDTPTVVLTHRGLPAIKDSIELFSGDLDELIGELQWRDYKNVWVVGGAAVVKEFIRSRLADEIRLMIVPVLIGEGTPFFDRILPEQPLHLTGVTAYKNGMVELKYEIKKNAGAET